MHIGYMLAIFNDDIRTGTRNNYDRLQTKIQRILRNNRILDLRNCLNQYLIQLVHP